MKNGRSIAILQITPDTLLSALGLPPGTQILDARFEFERHRGALLLKIEGAGLPQTFPGDVIFEVSAQFRDGHFAGWCPVGGWHEPH